MMNKFSAVGADVEFCALNHDGEYTSVIDIIPGTKDCPHMLPNGGGLQVDNVLVEFNVPPAKTAEDYYHAFNTTQHNVHTYLEQVGLHYDYVTSAKYPMSELQHRMAKVIGCGFDYNAWTGEPNTKPSFVIEDLRTCGGHVHFSWEEEKSLNPHDPELKKKVFKVSRLLDQYVGLKSLFLDTDSVRRSLYGKAGSCRIKRYSKGIYGGEYRTLSNYWTKPEYQGRYIMDIFNKTKFIIDNLDELDDPIEDVEVAINTHNLHKAEKLIEAYGTY